MDGTPEADPARVGDLVELLRRRWWVILLALGLGTAAGWYVGDRQPPTYTSTIQVLVQPTGVDSGPDEINLDTEAQLVTSVRTADRARSVGGLELPARELTERVEVSVPANTEVLEVSFEASTPTRAQRGATAFAQAYLAHRAEDADTASQELVAALTERIDVLRDDGAAGQVVAALETERARLQATPARAGEVISPADLPDSPSSPIGLLYLLSGLVAGLLLGVSAALLMHRVDTRVAGAGDLPAPVAGQVRLDLRGRRPGPAVAGATTPPGRQFTRLRTALAAGAEPDRPPGETGGWLICAARPGAAAGLVTANLAAALARAGGRVVVVAADPASPVLTALGVRAGPGRGLAEVLDGTAGAPEVLVPAPAAPGVAVLPPGRLDPAAELPVTRTSQVLAQLGTEADHLLLETPPVSRTSDAPALAHLASAVLLVVEKHRTRRAEVLAAWHDLAQVGAPLAGAVLVPRPLRRRARRPGWPVLRLAGPVGAPGPDPT